MTPPCGSSSCLCCLRRVAESLPLLPCMSMTHVACDALPAQMAAYCVSALAGGIMFYRWRRLGQEEKQRVWRLYVLPFPHRNFVTF